MKQILISIKPKWVAKILNREKTIEIRKTAPKEWVDYLNGKTDKKPEPMVVYIYCTKGDKEGLVFDKEGRGLVNKKLFPYAKNCPDNDRLLNGKVVAKFTLKDVYAIWAKQIGEEDSVFWALSCLTCRELDTYLKGKIGYAWPLRDLEIFDEPKELSEFSVKKKYKSCFECPHYEYDSLWHCQTCKEKVPLKRAPQSWCYVEERQ